jgi:hypothetical protein
MIIALVTHLIIVFRYIFVTVLFESRTVWLSKMGNNRPPSQPFGGVGVKSVSSVRSSANPAGWLIAVCE